jgi:hypothetical protein
MAKSDCEARGEEAIIWRKAAGHQHHGAHAYI